MQIERRARGVGMPWRRFSLSGLGLGRLLFWLAAPEGGRIGSDVDVLDAAERRGLQIAVLIRTGLVLAVMIFSIVSQEWRQGLVAMAFMLPFLAVGIAMSGLIVHGRDRSWMRYAYIALDFVALGVVASLAPLTTGGDLPQILIFRVYGVDVFYFIVATSALSLSPRLVLWAGGVAIATIWSVWLALTLDMPRTLSWSDLPASAPGTLFIEVFLDPDFTGRGNRLVESFCLAATALVLAVAVDRARRLLRRQLIAERAKARVSAVFGRFVPDAVVEQLTRSGGRLTASERMASVLFVDVEGSTTLAETMPPERLIGLFDAFFDRVSALVAAHRGVVISLIGDGALVAFNAPLDNRDHAADAVAAGRALLAMAKAERFGETRLSLRIGIATGRVAAGTVGGDGRQAYTLYGDTVNLAQRLEAMNKDLGTRLAVSAATWAAADRPADLVLQGARQARGRREAEAVYALATATAAATGTQAVTAPVADRTG
ncbi:MAG: adenylate/guanylate cyclase domain-containing protein [Pseudomonadota bacterium]